MSADQSVVMQVPEQLLQSLIQVQVAEMLARQGPNLVRDLVSQALSEKDPNSYGRQTIFQSLVHKHIRDVAQSCASEYLDALRPEIETEVRKMIGAQVKRANPRAKDLAEKLVAAICGNVSVSIHIKETL